MIAILIWLKLALALAGLIASAWSGYRALQNRAALGDGDSIRRTLVTGDVLNEIAHAGIFLALMVAALTTMMDHAFTADDITLLVIAAIMGLSTVNSLWTQRRAAGLVRLEKEYPA